MKLNQAIDQAPSRDAFLTDVWNGLSCPQQKTLPCKWLYDALGSRLFDAITALDEYYPTRTETALLGDIAPEIAKIAGVHARIVELGSGAGVKVRLLLDALERPSAYVAVDISETALRDATRALANERTDLRIVPVLADYTRPFALPSLEGWGNTLGFFPGSTIGNFAPAQAIAFLTQLRRQLGNNAFLLIGVDLKKDRDVLERAYDDVLGVTAAFNLNLLARINRELSADFDVRQFAHKSIWNEAQGRIEMHLVSTVAQTVTIDGRAFEFRAGETIHTENSYKYGIDQFQRMAASAGWQARAAWTDGADLFSLHLLQA
ncbi:L-histidine N(alpha)-methyltransferase [Roseiterribacter gracilis]|uniref:Dimethylhistidine N-methyltransferase n=1 Tax=Roseiterribacter gracilis TaxID=2812848 RepID=A0A8S8X9S1_9PROT|nr:dimethylhistidine N-methyltransferase [Rhodospirillales bacterium TMPK1]